ncbi:MAG: J domain-containing protein [Thermoguttaceae bacterium]|jgi:curved DNA-binding protein CbpA|nr:J domain-containing protein [Thermoguttaceae bacterium]
MDPYAVLGVDRNAGEAEVRRRYLEMVRQHPPDRDPEGFRAVRNAYEQLRDPVRLLESRLFHPETGETLETVIVEFQRRIQSARIPTAVLLSLAERP